MHVDEVIARKDINVISVETLDRVEVAQSGSPIKLWGVPQSNPNFTGRLELLHAIRSRLHTSSGNSTKPVVVTACHGLGGVGKTQLVLEYVYQNRESYQFICWIQADTQNNIELAYEKLAKDLKLVTEEASLDDCVSAVKNALTTNKSLLVLDNAPNYETVERFIPPIGTDVLITSRYTEWLNKGIEVDVFSLEEAKEYIKKILGESAAESEKAIELANLLGRLPLALAHAVAYIKISFMSIGDYIELYKKEKHVLLSKKSLPAGDKHEAVYITWDISFNQVKSQSPLAEVLFYLCAFLSNEKIPIFLLEACTGDKRINAFSAVNLAEAIGLLSSYSLVQVSSDKLCLSMHCLVQECVSKRLPEKDMKAYFELVIEFFNKVFPLKDTTVNDHEKFKLLMPHLEIILSCASQIRVKDEQMASFYLNAGDIKLEFSKPVDALKYYLLALDLMRVLYTKDDYRLASVHNDLGNAYGENDENEKAKQNYEESIRIKKLHLDFNDISLSDSYNNLAITLRYLGEDKQCLEYHLKALAIRQHHQDEIKTALSLNNIGFFYLNNNALDKAQEYLPEAEKYLIEALALRRKVYRDKPNHPNVAQTLYNLGCVYTRKKDFAAAFKYHDEAYQIRKLCYGEAHRLVADSLDSLAIVCREEKQMKTAVKYHKEALKIFETVFPGGHRDIGECCQALADTYLSFSDKKNASQYLKRAHETFQKFYGEAHPRTKEVKDKMMSCEAGQLTSSKDILFAQNEFSSDSNKSSSCTPVSFEQQAARR